MTDLQKDGREYNVIGDKSKSTPSRISEMQIGNTMFTIISVQSDNARESAFDKVKKLILDHASDVAENVSESSNK